MNTCDTHRAPWRPWFFADWRQFFFLHYALPPEILQRATPLPLDTRDGRAFFSLVFFRLENMRLAAPLPRWLATKICRPVSDHWFLNLRTYVVGPEGPGIQFLTEWVDNPVSAAIGPALYGLPYRKGKFARENPGRTRHWRLHSEDVATRASIDVELTDTGEHRTAPEPIDTFLLEKYTAYMVHRGATRYFHIHHPPWNATQVRVEQVRDSLISLRHGWFPYARLVAAHASAGFGDVEMGPPQRVRPRRRSRSAWFAL